MNKLAMEFEGICVGSYIFNPDVGDFIVVAINPKKDRVLLAALNKQNPTYIGAYALQKHKESDTYYWCQGHYCGDRLDLAVDYVMDIERGEE